MAALPARTPYQVENDVSTLLKEHKDQIDYLLNKYGDREDDPIVLYRFLKAFNFKLEEAEHGLNISLVID